MGRVSTVPSCTRKKRSGDDETRWVSGVRKYAEKGAGFERRSSEKSAGGAGAGSIATVWVRQS